MYEGEIYETSNGNFAIELIKIIYKPGHNMVISPFSLTSALLMLLAGASGTTRTDILNVLFKARDRTKIDESHFKMLLNSLSKVWKKLVNDNKDVLRLANMLYSRGDFPIKKQYADSILEQFHGVAKELDFEDQEKTINQINEDVKKATKEMIPSIVTNIDPMIRMVLINAFHFKDAWKHPFLKDSLHEGDFKLSNGEIIKVTMMSMKKVMPHFYCKSLKVNCVRFEYTISTVSMVILLPDNETNMKTFIEKMDCIKMDYLLNNLKCFHQVKVTIPRFKMEATHRMIPYLNELGLRTIFVPDANLSGISDQPLYVSEMIQKTFIEVNEKGTEASVVTKMELQRTALFDTKEFIVDRAFIFMLVSNDNYILLNGIIENPIIST